VQEGSKSLCPDDTKVANSTEVNVSEGAVKNITQQMTEEANHNYFTAVVAIR
jgi:hypothetical protein